MSKPRSTRAYAKPRKPSNTERRKPAVQRTPARRRWIGWTAAGVMVAAVAAVIAVSAGDGHGAPATNRLAPNGVFSTTSGASETVASLRGQPTLLWFVATWCSSCQAGTQAVASQIDNFAARHVRIVELEFAGDLGQPGPSIAAFGSQLAGPAYHNPDWTFGVASGGLTSSYDPSGYLDIYYLLDGDGRIVYTNGGPASTMSQLLDQVARISPE